MYNSLWFFLNVFYNVRSTRVFMFNYLKNNFLSSFSFFDIVSIVLNVEVFKKKKKKL